MWKCWFHRWIIVIHRNWCIETLQLLSSVAISSLNWSQRINLNWFENSFLGAKSLCMIICTNYRISLVIVPNVVLKVPRSEPATWKWPFHQSIGSATFQITKDIDETGYQLFTKFIPNKCLQSAHSFIRRFILFMYMIWFVVVHFKYISTWSRLLVICLFNSMS